jgi:hypothetical protein
MKSSSNNNISDAIGIVLLIGVIILILKAVIDINKKAETKLYSEEALDKLDNDESFEKLEEAVSDYHKKGKWDKEKLAKI